MAVQQSDGLEIEAIFSLTLQNLKWCFLRWMKVQTQSYKMKHHTRQLKSNSALRITGELFYVFTHSASFLPS
jgi:hypothetical protein